MRFDELFEMRKLTGTKLKDYIRSNGFSKDGHYQHSVWLLDVAMGVCRTLGAERLFPGDSQ